MWIGLALICMLTCAVDDVFSRRSIREPVIDSMKNSVWYAVILIAFMILIYVFGFSESGDMPWVLAFRFPEAKYSALFLGLGSLIGLMSFRSLSINEKCSIHNCDTLFLLVMVFAVYKLSGKAAYAEDLISPLPLIGMALIITSAIFLPQIDAGEKEPSERNKAKRKSRKLFRIDMGLCFLAAALYGADDLITGYALNEAVADSVDYVTAYVFWILFFSVPIYLYIWIKEKKPYHPFQKSEKWLFIYNLFDAIVSILYIVLLAIEPIRGPILVTAYPIVTFAVSKLLYKEHLSRTRYLCLTVMTFGVFLLCLTKK